MAENQFHYGKKFYQDKATGYWISTSSKKIRAHVWVWQYHHGKVPKKYHIHHKNGNKSDNQIENLQLIKASTHMSLHMQDPVRKKFASDMANKYRHLSKAWHKSEKGKTWHKAHGMLSWLNRKEIKIKCKCCNKEAITKTYHQEFCSNACKSQWRRDQGIDNVIRKCLKCGIEFEVNKYSKQKTCGKSCMDDSKKLLIEEMIQMRVAGFTYQEIGLKFNIPRERTSKMINKYQVTHRTF